MSEGHLEAFGGLSFNSFIPMGSLFNWGLRGQGWGGLHGAGDTSAVDREISDVVV